MTGSGELVGKVALVTGGTSGIGLAAARSFLAAGATVYATGIDRIERARAALPGVTFVESDAGSVAAIAALAALIGDEQGNVDILMLNAGAVAHGDLSVLNEQQFDRVFAVNAKGILFAVQAFAPLMTQGGSIIVTTSTSGRTGMAAAHLYSASKAAAAALVRTLSSELAPRGIRVNAIAPGSIETGLGETGQVDPETRRRMIEATLARVPMGRRGQPGEIAGAAMFLASDASSYLTGQELVVDGGMLGQG